MMNSSRLLSRADVLAMENDRTSSVPGTVTSTYCPGKNLNSSSPVRASTRCRMSPVTGSLATTSATASVTGSPDLIISSSKFERLDRHALVDVRPAQQGEALVALEVGSANVEYR